MESKSLMEQLIEEMVIGVLKVNEEGLIELNLFIEENQLNFGELANIQEHFSAISEILVNYFNRL